MKSRILAAVVLLSLTLVACEDDPILTPHPGTAASGSYSRINPPTPPDSVRSRVDRPAIQNPTLF